MPERSSFTFTALAGFIPVAAETSDSSVMQPSENDGCAPTPKCGRTCEQRSARSRRRIVPEPQAYRAVNRGRRALSDVSCRESQAYRAVNRGRVVPCSQAYRAVNRGRIVPEPQAYRAVNRGRVVPCPQAYRAVNRCPEAVILGQSGQSATVRRR